MSGSSFGQYFKITTWGESHGPAIGVVVDGVPAGLALSEDDIQIYLDRRKPGQSKYTTQRQESDTVEILSGVFEGVTTGCPISLMVRNKDQHSKDYASLATVYRPGHADYCFEQKYGIRDYRGGGRSSARETIGRVAAGAIACKILKELDITFLTYTKSIGPLEITKVDVEELGNNPFNMPDAKVAAEAAKYLDECIASQTSVGGVVECHISGLPVGLGEPVFDKLDANLAKAILSIGAVKGFEIGDGFAAAASTGDVNNDAFAMADGRVTKLTNHSGGVLGGMSDGSEIVFRAAFKPTPSIARPQKTVTNQGEDTTIEIHGRHDPIVVARAGVVVESMAALTVVDALFANMASKMDGIKGFYKK